MKMRMKRMMGLFLALVMSIGCLSLNPIASYADDTDAKTFNINQGSVNITKSGTYTIEGTGQPTPNEIRVTGDSITAKITLKNVNIDVSNQIYNSAFLAKGYGQSNVQLTIILQGTNSLKSGEERAGLTWNNHNNSSTLEIEGDGSLTATGGKNGAGIGSSWNHNGGTRNITITGGTVIATGGYGAAGIGGDRGNSAENIKIAGGTVTATGGDGAAGIGGGGSDSGKNITITGGTVTATGGGGAAGIGGGRQGGSGENITITGGTVTATGGDGAAGIGGGDRGSGKGLTIAGGTVTATGGDMTAGIGGGTRGSGENITIAGGTVTATGGEDGIGGGAWGAAQHIKITGGSVKANSISTTPTDDNGHNVYLVKLENQDSVNEVTVDSGTANKKTFKRAGSHPDRDTTFYLYLTGKGHDLLTSKGEYKAEWNGNTNAFTIFDPANVKSMSVTSQPTKLKYTEGETLDLTGLEVTLEDANHVKKVVTPAEFEANGIKATPENGKKLELTDGGKPVTLKRGNLTATTNDLKVAKLNPTSMSVTSQPTKLKYTEGETLDLTGLEVTLEDANHVKKVVTPAEFEANGIKATPENGKKLELTDGGKPVTLKRGNLTAETSALKVKARVLFPSFGAGMNDYAPTTVDKGELNIQIDSAESDSKLGHAGAGAGATVKQAADALDEALALAKRVAANPNATQAQVDAATRRLADARKALADARKSQQRIGVIPKTGESTSFAGLLAALGFSIVGLEILRKKKMMEENNK
ncbi:LPXTG-motif cell wall anchor domain protein [Mageeibacillus indolicus UPII9-5]|uniref:LPXTG-motif cell wall anchor domain protein n=1 Tax=Mageeibacillus indolicus (strain UPII9-5) TaxID=699246 RepID=D3R249_MAGIU|nr:hypothetical protein [Mageeibacillus indolicus]ADC90612.1 LPXTG-motif cell wall anchor domain protein [Mageeibacillus indolicus UPII9-5]